MDDHQLLRGYFKGNEQAFETLVRKYFRMVYAVAGRQTGDPHLAEELAQSVFIILSRKAPGLSPKTSIPGWLLRTTRFVSRDAIKMRRRRDENERKLAMNLESQLETTPSTMGLLLEEAIQALSPDEQVGIAARFFEGKDFQEIAQMFSISEDAARKRTSRCLTKLQAFMERRGAKVSLQALSSLLVVPPAHQAATMAVQSAIQAIHAAWQGNVSAANAVALANHAARLVRWRFLTGPSLKIGVPVLIIFLGLWMVRQPNRSASTRIERLGKAWGALDQRVAQHRQFLIQTPPTAANYQATVQQEIGAISRESSRIIGELTPLLSAPDERNHLATFLTAELDNILNLDSKQKTALFSYIQNRVSQNSTLNDAMKTLAQATTSETAEIKAMLTREQQQRFDKIYGADGVLLFSYPKAVALGKIGA